VPDVVLPVLNESQAIRWVLSHIPPGYDPIVVDNGSSDGSAALARTLGARVVHEPRRGFGAACFTGLLAATSDVVCFMDCDGSLDPRQLPLVAEPVIVGDADLALGSRRAGPGAWPLHARVANRWLAARVSREAHVRLTDLGPMRSARREALLSLGIEDRRSGWPLEMVLKAIQAGWTIQEVPVEYLARAGRSKVTGTVRGSVRAVGDMAAVLRRVEVGR
jgi:glycosyltransferase involved in cell wall biosynthesis